MEGVRTVEWQGSPLAINIVDNFASHISSMDRNQVLLENKIRIFIMFASRGKLEVLKYFLVDG